MNSLSIISKPKNFSLEVKNFAQELSCPLFVADLLLQKNIKDKEEARNFFLCSPVSFSENEEMYNLQESVQLLQQLHQNKSKIMIHGDYDVDGITGTTILYLFLKNAGFQVDWFIPNRFKDGYGITCDNIRKFAQEKFEWIITVDTGISANKEVSLANQLGLHTLITDHHQPGDDLPCADLILNPNQPDCPYPNKSLCGAGVAWKLVNQYAKTYLNSDANDLIYLVAIASLSDVVEINSENRFLIKQGLKQIITSPSPAIKHALNETNLSNKSNLSSNDILFKISPTLNSAGRLASASLSVNFLTSTNLTQAKDFFSQLKKLNTQRRSIEKEASENALSQIKIDQKKSCVVLHSQHWHEGVLGILASKILDITKKPTIILSCKNGVCKASGRSVLNFNLHKALASCQELLVNWGGHYYACGFTILEKNLPALKKHLNTLAQTYLPNDFYLNKFFPHTQITLNEINNDTLLWLARFEPSGTNNPQTLFYCHRVQLQNIQIIGEQHLKFTIKNYFSMFEGIYFFSHHLFEQIKNHESFNIAFHLEYNYFRQQKNIQFLIKGIEAI